MPRVPFFHNQHLHLASETPALAAVRVVEPWPSMSRYESDYIVKTSSSSHQSHHVIDHSISSTGTLAEWLTRCPAKAIPSGACVRITQVSINRFFCFLARHSVHTVSQSAQSIFCYQKAACDFFGFAKGQLVPERACGQCNNSTWYTCATVDRWSIDISEKGISRGIS